MTIISLEYLVGRSQLRRFSLAAEHCFVTQPSLSMQVKALEEELGVVLLDRSKKPVIPTEAGDVVLERARETLRAYNNIRESVAELKGETSVNSGWASSRPLPRTCCTNSSPLSCAIIPKSNWRSPR